MRKLGLIGFTMLVGTAVPVVAVAGDQSGDHEAMFKSMDTDGDGKISAAEHVAAAKKMFELMDANKDGKVTAEEMTAAHEKMTGKKAGPGEMSSAEKIKVIDTDGDGALSADEHAAGSKMMFEKMDTNKDGFLTKAEMTAGHKKLMKK
jgi:Ca2+-binding EF-hand superfamily protein